MKKLVLGFIFILYTTFILFIGYQLGDKEKQVEECGNIISDGDIDNHQINGVDGFIRVSGLIASYRHIDRQLKLQYFYELDATVTRQKLEEEIGKPNGQYGSGIIYDYYEIDDNLYVSIMAIGSESNPEGKINSLQLCTHEKTIETIYLR